MIIDDQLKQQTLQYLQLLESEVVFTIDVDDSDASKNLEEFIKEICDLDSRLSYVKGTLERTPAFSIDRKDHEKSGVVFAGVPLGHEYNSFILALIQVSGRAPKISDELAQSIKNIQTDYHFITYASLTCHNCPDVVQALNILSILNPHISHTMIDGAVFKDEVEAKNIMAVPVVYANDEFFLNGRSSLEAIVEKLGISDNRKYDDFTQKLYDVLVIGGGPAGISSAIYAARKGIKVALVLEHFGGQVIETLGIENIIGTPYIEGESFANALEEHLRKYDNVDVLLERQAAQVQKNGAEFNVTLDNQVILKSKTVIIATGAHWRNINVPGEQEFQTKGVAYCPHCDAPLYKNKDVAVIGGGNSGMEATIDLANVAHHVTLFERSDKFKADDILLERAKKLSNVDLLTNAQTEKITGQNHVEGLDYQQNGESDKHLTVDGVFVQIGLVPNTEWLNGDSVSVKLNDHGEIMVDKYGATNIEGLYAAGDCTDSSYKQIIISMGSGATAALGAFDYLIRD